MTSPNRSRKAQKYLAAAHQKHTRKQSVKVALCLGVIAMFLHALWPITVNALLLPGTIDLSNLAANYALDQLYDGKFPASSNLLLRTGAVAGAENADSGTVVATIVLPASPWAAASAGSKAKSGTWQDASADNAGTVGHYRLTGTTTTFIEEGSVTATGGGGDMTLDNNVVTAAQVVTITSFTRSL